MQSPKPYREERPWGEELWLLRDTVAPSMVKLITVKPGEALSLQFHHNRDEFWHVISGNGTAEIDGEAKELTAGVDCFVPKGINHRVKGGTETLLFMEMTFGEFDENDIVRLEDKYGRS